MANYALLTAVGPDRPGIVAGVSAVFYRTGCNIEDSKMARLGGTFACMLVLRLPDGLTSQQLAEPLEAVRAELGLWLRLSDLSPAEAVEPAPDLARHVVDVYGADRPGIVYEVAAHLAAHSVNITNLTTRVLHRTPTMYVMSIEIEVPNFVDTTQLEADLSEIGRRIDVDVTLERKPDADA